jgi:hypothetical protein
MSDNRSLEPRPVWRRLSDITEPDPPIGSGWGPWTLNPANYTLELGPDGCLYWVDLEDCDTAAQVLDWIAQVARKTWADDTTLAGLVRALNDVLNLQSSLCPSGQSKRMTNAQIRARVRTYAQRAG